MTNYAADHHHYRHYHGKAVNLIQQNIIRDRGDLVEEYVEA